MSLKSAKPCIWNAVATAPKGKNSTSLLYALSNAAYLLPFHPLSSQNYSWHFTFLERTYLYIKYSYYLLYLFHGHATCEIVVYYGHVIFRKMHIKFHICCSLQKIENHTEQKPINYLCTKTTELHASFVKYSQVLDIKQKLNTPACYQLIMPSNGLLKMKR